MGGQTKRATSPRGNPLTEDPDGLANEAKAFLPEDLAVFPDESSNESNGETDGRPNEGVVVSQGRVLSRRVLLKLKPWTAWASTVEAGELIDVKLKSRTFDGQTERVCWRKAAPYSRLGRNRRKPELLDAVNFRACGL